MLKKENEKYWNQNVKYIELPSMKFNYVNIDQKRDFNQSTFFRDKFHVITTEY